MNKSKIITYGIIALVLIVGGWYVYKTNAAAADEEDKTNEDASNAFSYTSKHTWTALPNTATGTLKSVEDRKKADRFMTW